MFPQTQPKALPWEGSRNRRLLSKRILLGQCGGFSNRRRSSTTNKEREMRMRIFSVGNMSTRYNSLELLVSDRHCSSWVGVTKAPFFNFSAREFFDRAKLHGRFFKSHSYLTDVTPAKLQWHLSNMNVIRLKIWENNRTGGNWISNPLHRIDAGHQLHYKTWLVNEHL